MRAPYAAILLSCSCLVPKASADQEAAPTPRLFTSNGGDYVFKIVPEEWRADDSKPEARRKAFGVAYKLDKDGNFQEMWRTEGWHASEAYLAEDGRHLVRIGPWATDQENHTDLAVAFYRDGKLLKQYEVRELIRKPDLLEDTVSHYWWRPEVQSKPTGFYGGTFHLVMIDKTAHSFEFETGELMYSSKDKRAKSSREIRDTEVAAAKKKGVELFDASAFKASFREHFELSGIEAMRVTFGGCMLKDPTWSAYLKPSRKFDHEVTVHAAFPVIDSERIEVELSAAEIIGAIEAAFRHPYIQGRFKGHGAKSLSLRILGDRLHWDSPDLEKHFPKLGSTPPTREELRRWAYLQISGETGKGYTSVYLDTKTGALIYEDESKWPWEPVMLDGAGKVVHRK